MTRGRYNEKRDGYLLGLDKDRVPETCMKGESTLGGEGSRRTSRSGRNPVVGFPGEVFPERTDDIHSVGKNKIFL